MKNILFVCKGNIIRSLVAEICLKRELAEQGIEDVAVESRGVQGSGDMEAPLHANLFEYTEIWEAAKPVLEELGLDEDLKNHHWKAVTKRDVDDADVVVAMDSKVMDTFSAALTKQFPDAESKMMLFSELEGKVEDVLDPEESTDEEAQRNVIKYICRVISEQFDKLI